MRYGQVKNSPSADGPGSVSWSLHSALGLHLCSCCVFSGLSTQAGIIKTRIGFWFFSPLFCSSYRSRNRVSGPGFYTDFMWPATWDQGDSNVLTHVKAHNVLFWGLWGSHGMWSINDLRCLGSQRSPPFWRGRHSLVLNVTAHAIIHGESSKHYIMPEKSTRGAMSFSSGVFAAHQSELSESRRALGILGERLWKPLVFLQSVNRLHSEGQIS